MGILDGIGSITRSIGDWVSGTSDSDRQTEWTGDPRNENAGLDYSVTRGPGGSLESHGPEWTSNPGTTYQRTRTDDPYLIDTDGSGGGADGYRANLGFGDIRNYQYGRSATGADEAVARAQGLGDFALGQGVQRSTAAQVNSNNALNRAAIQGQYGQQNAALGTSLGYGGQLASLEKQQGPSAAQAQLNQGTNQALASQLALARSGRGFGGNAAAMGLAQGNTAGIMANNANQSAMLRAQEDAAWRGRQATNLGNAAGIAQGAGTQYGQQSMADLNAALQSRQQNDTAALGWGAQSNDALNNAVAANFNGQSLSNQIRSAEMSGGQTAEDNALRQWAAKNNYNLAQQARQDQQEAALLQFGATTTAAALDD